MSTYSAFPVYPAIAGTMSSTIYTPDAANGGTLRITLTGTAFSVRFQISNAASTTGQPHLFIPPEVSWETQATATSSGIPVDMPGPIRWLRLIVDSGTVAGGNVEESSARSSASLDVVARASATAAQTAAATAQTAAAASTAAIGNTLQAQLALRGQADGSQFVEGNRWLFQPSGTVGGGVVVAANGGGVWVRENFGPNYATWAATLGNGTPQTALFQAAVNAAAGKTLIIPQGMTVIVDAPITIPDGTVIQNDGLIRASGTFPILGGVLLSGNYCKFTGAGAYDRTLTSSTQLFAIKIISKTQVVCQDITTRNGLAPVYVTAGNGSGDYANITEASMSSYISIRNPVSDGQNLDKTASGPDVGVAAVQVEFCKNWEVTGGNLANFLYGVQYWGGDANPAINGAWTNVRKNRDGLIRDVVVHDTRGGGQWGSMGERIEIVNPTAINCADVCLDFEGSIDCYVRGGLAQNGANGNLAFFFENRNCGYQGTRSIVTVAGGAVFRTHGPQTGFSPNNYRNFARDIIGEGRGVLGSIDNNGVGPSFDLEISGKFHNVTMNIDHTGQDSIYLHDARFTFDLAPAAAKNAVNINTVRRMMELVNVSVETSVAWPAGSAAVSVNWYDSTMNGTVELRGLTMRGFPIDLILGAAGANAGYVLSGRVKDCLFGAGVYNRSETGAGKGKIILESCANVVGMSFPDFPAGTSASAWFTATQKVWFTNPSHATPPGMIALTDGLGNAAGLYANMPSLG